MTLYEAFIKRGNLVESSHLVKCIVKNSTFNNVLTTKNDKDFVFPRSSIKIFQALPFVISGSYKKFDLNRKILALSCSSHTGEDRHIKILKEWLMKINLSISDLKCGIHNPVDRKSSEKNLLKGELPSQLHNNCSGKHLAMLTGCLSKNIDIKKYLNTKHPYQKLIRDSLEYFTDSKIKKKSISIDGCSAPQYAFQLKDLASAMVKLSIEKEKKSNYGIALLKLLNSIKKYPELIGGKKRFDSETIKVSQGRIFCKGGAEGVLLFSDLEKKIGGIIKVVDGNERIIPIVAIKIFQKLKILNKIELTKLQRYSNSKIYNHAGKKVGSIVF